MTPTSGPATPDFGGRPRVSRADNAGLHHDRCACPMPAALPVLPMQPGHAGPAVAGRDDAGLGAASGAHDIDRVEGLDGGDR